MKRFYDAVDIREAGDDAIGQSGWQVTLDGRGLKTVLGSEQIAPSRALAERLAREWSEQAEDMDPKTFVLRDMTDYAIDVVDKDRNSAIDKLLAYGETDTLCYRADPEDALFGRQQEMWEPLLVQLEEQTGETFTRISGIVHRPQSKAMLAKLRARIEPASSFVLAALESMASLAASLSVAVLASEPDSDPAALWRAASLEEDWQADLWGRDPEAEARREKRHQDFMLAHEFVALARS